MKKKIKVIILFVPYLLATFILYGIDGVADFIMDTKYYWKDKEEK